MNTTAQDVASAAAGPSQEDNKWPTRLGAWKKYSESFHARGEKIERRYEDERDTDTNMSGKKVNMFYSNTTVIKESLYNSLPKPEVTRMHKGDWDNEPARVAAAIMERSLSYEVRCAKHFDAAMRSAILDRLVPGIGTIWVNFVAAGTDGRGIPAPEHMTIDIVYWKDLLWEPQRTWESVTWVGRKLSFSVEDARARWGESALSTSNKDNTKSTAEGAINQDKVIIIQMWDKTVRKVYHLTEDGRKLDEVDDPYKLRGFFPTPRPLIASPPTRKFLPLQDYYMAQDQYLEMDILYSRINLIIEAIRVAGVYDASQPALARMLNGSENNLIPVDNWAMFAEKGGVKGSIDWFPVETIAQVLNHLTTTYAFIKNQLFEVTGMADIVRGSSNQYETLGAQQIKAQFASVRLNGFQRDVSTFVQETLRIMAEVMCELYSDEKLSATCGQLPGPDQQYVPAALEMLRSDYVSKYNISIQADSLTQADWGLEQGQRMGYVQSLAQFLTSAVPAAQANPELAPLLVQIIKFASVGFKGSNELEGTLDSILDKMLLTPPQKEEKPDPAVQKAQAEIQALQQKNQMELQMKQQEFQLKQQERAAELQFKQQMHAMDLQFAREKQAMELQKQQTKSQLELFQMQERQEREHMQDNARAAAGIEGGE